MLIIGIAGGTGCGKTTVVNKILKELPEGEVGVISQDSYYNDTTHLSYEERITSHSDNLTSIDINLFVETLKVLRKGNPMHHRVYTFVHHNRPRDTIVRHPRKVMIVEGILILTHAELRDLVDIEIFVQAA